VESRISPKLSGHSASSKFQFGGMAPEWARRRAT